VVRCAILTNQKSGKYNAFMPIRRLIQIAALSLFVASPQAASAQVTEATGPRALGMGGAFVAVASDSSATWWNPAGLAAGPFFDMSLTRTALGAGDELPAWRQKTSSFSMATPPVGFAYYRFRITDIQPFDPTGQGAGDREDGRVGVPVRSLSASQFGVTLVQTLIPGVHAGATLKYVRGSVRAGREDSDATPSDLLDRGEGLEGGDSHGRFDADVGVIAVAGAFRAGARMRNVMEPAFEDVQLPRQTRVGVAFDPKPVTGVPLTIALDADVRTYASSAGQRRVVALGAEHWLLSDRLALRGGGRVNTVGARERVVTGGASWALRPGMYVDGHVVRGGSNEENGWGVATRVSF
jgi:hypothetical protein